ncbi:MAG: hypothetical protein ACTHKT_12405 [Solirubrobacterales bacterium]
MVALIAALHGNPLAGSHAAGEAPKAFCSSPGPRDYTAPLSKLPPINPVPPRSGRSGQGNLPFGPGTVEMYLDTEGPVLVKPDRFGYGFFDHGYERSPPVEMTPLGWTVAAQLWSLDSAGRQKEVVDERQIHIGRIDDAYQPNLDLTMPDAVGFYRYDIQISDGEGNELGSYSTYLRVVPEFIKVRLGINSGRFRPGQTVATRPEVLGTNPITYGEDFEVQRMRNGRWQRDWAMTQEEWRAWLGSAGLGGAGSCSSFTIPANTPAGRYRVRKQVGVELHGIHWLPLTLTAPFSVTKAELSQGTFKGDREALWAAVQST